ncbi:MAG TPA: hypothetical protein VGZ25_15485, partial [Gemmataceae bacterium]|nr:hypothetical protein [Gemmataceae bacterium]
SADPAQIEAHVFERMETVRRYQLQDPELATEAMNRLAQAFVCLTNPESKKAYDVQFLVPPPPRRRVSSPALPVAPPLPRAIEMPDEIKLEEIGEQSSSDPLAWMYRPPGEVENELPAEPVSPAEEQPIPVTPESPTTIIDALDTLTELTALSDKTRQEEKPSAFEDFEGPVSRPDPIVEAARSSDAAKSGLHTKRSLYHRIAKTRELIRAWGEAGEYMGNPGRRLTKPVEATELIYLLGTIRSLLRGFPPLLGKAGQPGYLVVALARQQVIVPTYQTLLPSQRETLARDWEAGKRFLEAHRDFLREELGLMRRRSVPARAFRVMRHLVGAHPGMILLILAIVALGVALWRTVYLGAMTKGFESFKVAKKDERPFFQAPTRPTTKQDIKPKKNEAAKIAEPSPATPKTLDPEPDKKDDNKTSPSDKPPRALDPEEKPLESPSPAKEIEDTTKLQVMIPPFRGGDEKSSLFAIRGLAFVTGKEADNPQFISCNRDFVTLWEMNDEKTHCSKINEKRFEGSISFLTSCPKTGAVAIGCEDGAVFLCGKDQTAGDAKILEKVKLKDSVGVMAFSPQGTWLASSAHDGMIQLLDCKRDSATRLHSEFSGTRSLAFMESGPTHWPLLVSGHADGSLCLWKVNSKEPVRVITQAHEGEISCLASSPDGKLIVTGGRDGIVQAWRLTRVFGKITGLERSSPPISPHRSDRPVNFLTFSIDSRYLLMVFADRAMEMIDILSNRKVIDNHVCPDLVSDAVFAPDGKTLLFGYGNGTMSLYALPKQLQTGAKSEK